MAKMPKAKIKTYKGNMNETVINTLRAVDVYKHTMTEKRKC